MKFAENFVLSFAVADASCQFRYERDGSPAFEAVLTEGRLIVSAWYSASEQPLMLFAEACPGDQIKLVVRVYRLELFVNDELEDEEWPCGKARFAVSDLAESAISPVYTILSTDNESAEEPDILYSFTGAEGWHPGRGVFVGDCMPCVYGGHFHIFCLKDRHHHKSKWGLGAHQWMHISSVDLIHWDVHPLAVKIENPSEGSMCTGSWICVNGVHQLYYTIRMADGSPAPILRSISQDGIHYRRDPSFSLMLSAQYTGSSARDPKMVLEEDGTMHMFVTTSLAEIHRGCLVHLVSQDGNNWQELGTIYVSPDADEPECSDYFCVNDKYYLIFSHYARAQYRISNMPFTEWNIPSAPYIPCHSVPKAAIWNERIIFVGFIPQEGYAGTMTFMEAVPSANGELEFFPLKEAHR